MQIGKFSDASIGLVISTPGFSMILSGLIDSLSGEAKYQGLIPMRICDSRKSFLLPF